MSPTPAAAALLIAALTLTAPVLGQSWSEERCLEEFTRCRTLINDVTTVGTCDHYNQTIACLDSYLGNSCVGQSLQAFAARNMTIKDYYCPGGCSNQSNFQNCIDSFPPPTPTTSPPDLSPTPSQDCTHSPPLSLSPSLFYLSPSDLGTPSLSHPLPEPGCQLPLFETHYRQHCSLFSLSHLRQFSSLNMPLSTSYIPGHVYLYKHKYLSISVNGAFKIGTVGYYTDITEVNVTLHNHSCFPHSELYSATVEEVPQPGQLPAGLHITVLNDSMATIIAPWINTTIVIHRSQGHLSVTLQVPEPLSRPGEVSGLCSDGYPESFRLTNEEITLPEYNCLVNREQVSVLCLMLGLSMPPLGITTYSDLCVFDILKTHDTSLLQLYSALNKDALLLPDVTEIITEAPTQVTTETTPTSKRPQAVSSVVIIPPSEDGFVSQAPPTTHPLISLSLLLPLLSLSLR